MLPSPSLGPPLLSASWSPPLFCGMPVDELEAAGASDAAARPDLRLDRFDLLVRPVILSGVGMSIPFLVLAFLSPAPDTPIAQAGVGMCEQCPAIRARMHR
jgi:hypothetical protein